MDLLKRKQKIVMIIIVLSLFLVQLYYSISFFITSSDMSLALSENDLTLIYLNNPSLPISRVVIKMLGTQSLNVSFLAGIMVLYLFIGSISFIELFYIAFFFILIYQYAMHKNKVLRVLLYSCSIRILVYLVSLVVCGLLILNVFLVGNASVEQIVTECNIFVLILGIVYLLSSLCVTTYSLYKIIKN